MIFPVRYLIAVLAISGIMVSYICRYNISVAIVAMVKKQDAIFNATLNSSVVVEPLYGHSGGEFEWNEATQGIVLGAYYYGYTIFQIFGGRMTEIFGAKWVFAISMFISGFVNIISPIAAHHSSIMFIACRAILGASQSAVFPAAYGLFCKWMHENERGAFLAMLNVGGSVGIILSSLMSGYLCKGDFLNGWPAVFYVSGSLNYRMHLKMH
ncbi:membrane transporter-like protein [Leptotrombidium deliense]|uniref:Membrane transporter-like protein n=1 Tax=Leptotrombidium deliense TaxID=299467 RepID=A0A443SCE6_9ACAR|nr:membrane transporter-like protein [Leptotrombidium deliense]